LLLLDSYRIITHICLCYSYNSLFPSDVTYHIPPPALPRNPCLDWVRLVLQIAYFMTCMDRRGGGALYKQYE